MAVPTLITDLSTTPASNSPAGSENVFPNLDDYLRVQAAFLASIRDNSGNGWVSPYLPLAGGTMTGSVINFTAATGTFSGNVQMASANGGQLAGLRNRVINGNFYADQRNAGAAQTITAAAALAYTVDRFYAYCTGANVTGQRVAGTAPNAFLYQFTGAASVTKIGFAQRIENLNCQDMAGQTATLSVGLSNSLLTTVTWTAWRANTANTFGTLASPTRTLISTGTFTVNSTLTRYSANITLPSAATTGIEIELSVGAQISGTWSIGSWQLELGSVATAFEQRPIGMELALCQRYFEVLPQAGTGSIQSSIATGQNHTATSGAAPLLFKTTKRATPTLSNAGTFRVYAAAGADIAVTGLSYLGLGLESAVASYTVASGLVAGNATLLGRITDTSGQISISAEL